MKNDVTRRLLRNVGCETQFEDGRRKRKNAEKEGRDCKVLGHDHIVTARRTNVAFSLRGVQGLLKTMFTPL
jgi:hypothetical protein